MRIPEPVVMMASGGVTAVASVFFEQTMEIGMLIV